MQPGNRLIHEKSPYLLQHAHNPVDWYPWGDEAFDVARRQGKPIFLSIGYSTCRWCHIMEREVFEDVECARILNDLMVSIKVDREERPDLDHVYMTAVQLLTGAGGWPMSAFLLPDGRLFYGGTYFPPGQFKRVVAQLAASYRDEREKVEQTASEVARSVADGLTPPAEERMLSRTLVSQALSRLDQQYDEVHGGFGGAPKFPPHGALALLIHAQRERPNLLQMISGTLDGMALGGIHDHIGGGFHRYSTDAEWFLPHFEKMLSDNALLARAYVDGYLLTKDPFYREVAEGIFRWAAREMTGPEGAFCTGMDAESEGVEGMFYLWRHHDIMSLLGSEDGELFCRAYQVTADGNYREEHRGLGRTRLNILYLKQRLSNLAVSEQVPMMEFETRMAHARARLLAARDQRVRPFTDDKVITAWNAMMVSSLAHAGRVLNDPHHIAAAEKAARFLLTHLYADGQLRRRWREGEVSREVFLDDHAFLIQALLELHETTGHSPWLEHAGRLADEMLARFGDDREGDFFFTPSDAEQPFVRPKEVLDQPIPSSSGTAAQALVRLTAATGDDRYRAASGRALLALSPWAARTPRGAENLALAIAQFLPSPLFAS